MLDKQNFLNRLQAELADLTSEERREALEYYEEYFADAGEENEADVLISLGSPEQVAEQIKAGLHKADEGMFTENGYREKAEHGNLPEIYGKREESRDGSAGQGEERSDAQDRGGCGGGAQNRNGYAGFDGTQNQGGPAGQSGAQSQNGYAYQNNGYRNQTGGYRQNGGRQSAHGQNQYGCQGQQAGEKKNKMSGGTLALLIIFGIFLLPVAVGLGIGAFGIILGILGTIFGVIVTFLVVVVALLVLGITLFAGGFPILFYNPFGGILCIATGCIFIALFLLCLALLVAICGKFFPWLIREVESFGKYLSRKWSERKQKGGRTV